MEEEEEDYGDQHFEDELEGGHIPAFAREWGGSRSGEAGLPVGIDPQTGARITEDEAVAEIHAEMPAAASAASRCDKLQHAATEDEAVADIRAEITAAAAASPEAAANEAGVYICTYAARVYLHNRPQSNLYIQLYISQVYT